MSDIAVGASTASPFRRVTAVVLVLVGIGAFVALLLLGAFAPDLRSGRNGGGHALSISATGYAALVRLADATGRRPRVTRDAREFTTEDLLVITPEYGSTNISEALRRQTKPTLIVLPKWDASPDPRHPGWAVSHGLLDPSEPQAVLAPGVQLVVKRRDGSGGGTLTGAGLLDGLTARAPAQLQVVTGIDIARRIIAQRFPDKAPDGPGPAPPELHPLLSDGKGAMVLLQLGDHPLYVLTDPDLLNNQGLKDVAQARTALAMLDRLNSTGDDVGIAFDVSLNGFGHGQSPLKLLFVPPFLAMTLSLAAALLLAAIHGFVRFGPVRPRTRAIAFGKAALVDNAALLVAKAGYQTRMGARYGALLRERGGPPSPPLAQATARLEAADSGPALLAAAQALHTMIAKQQGAKRGNP